MLGRTSGFIVYHQFDTCFLKVVEHIQSTLGFATMGKAANLCLATRNAVTDLF